MRSMATPTDQNDMMNSTTATAMAVGPICLEHVDEVETAAALLRERRGADKHHCEPGTRDLPNLTHLPTFHYCILRERIRVTS